MRSYLSQVAAARAGRRRTIAAVCAVSMLGVLSARAVSNVSPGSGIAPPKPMLAEPGISPDARVVAFASAGDIWTVPTAGGEARLLVTHPATESRPLYAPDGKSLAFISNRTGNGDIYLLSLETSELKRLTWDDSQDTLSGFSPDSKWVYFNSGTRDPSGLPDVWRVSVAGGTPSQVLSDPYLSEYHATAASDGRRLAFSARGIGSSQWWRRGSSHIDENDIWVWDPAAKSPFARVTDDPRDGEGERALWPLWAPDGRGVFYISDRSGSENLWFGAPGSRPRQISRLTDQRMLFPSLSGDGKVLVYENHFGLFRMDTTDGTASAIPIRLVGATGPTEPQRVAQSTGFPYARVSPDGKKAAVVARGEIFVAGTAGEPAFRVTSTLAGEGQPEWAPDSRRLAYYSERDGYRSLYLFDFAERKETRLTTDLGGDEAPRFSPDGRRLAYQRAGRELRVLDLDTMRDRRVAEGYFERAPFESQRQLAWSPSGDWIAYFSESVKAFKNVWIARAVGAEAPPYQVSFAPNVFATTLSWSSDGRFILFDSGQRTESWSLFKLDLLSSRPEFREDAFDRLFGPAAEVKKPPTQLIPEIADLKQRTSALQGSLDVDSHTLSPDNRQIAVVATTAGRQLIHILSLDAAGRLTGAARPLVTTAGSKSQLQFSADGKQLYFLEDGRLQVVVVDSGVARTVPITCELSVRLADEAPWLFRETWEILRDNFYDPTFHGKDWAAVRGRYEPFALGARTADELRRMLNLMVGELDASHLGVSGPINTASSIGKLGISLDGRALETSGVLRVSEVLPGGPAAITRRIARGTEILAVNGREVDRLTNLDELLFDTIDKRVALKIRSVGAPEEVVNIRPVTGLAERPLLYRNWVHQRREFVHLVSEGRLGYVHVSDMSQQSLTRLIQDLDSENQARDGVVIDLRNNNGGFVNAYALDIFARQPYLTMRVRGFEPAPGRTVLGQRALERPTILLINRHSLSDAEDFTEGYRHMKLGKVLGEPTAGWIIYTSSVSLRDGTSVRVPFVEVRGAAGDVMERNPRKVDQYVQRPLGEDLIHEDAQLQAAVTALLKERPKRASESGGVRP